MPSSAITRPRRNVYISPLSHFAESGAASDISGHILRKQRTHKLHHWLIRESWFSAKNHTGWQHLLPILCLLYSLVCSNRLTVDTVQHELPSTPTKAQTPSSICSVHGEYFIQICHVVIRRTRTSGVIFIENQYHCSFMWLDDVSSRRFVICQLRIVTNSSPRKFNLSYSEHSFSARMWAEINPFGLLLTFWFNAAISRVCVCLSADVAL